jgi:type VI secretion system secreted protein VgrG
MATSDGSPTGLFELRAGPFSGDELRVVSFRGREALSRPSSFEVIVAPRPEVAGREHELLGALAVLVVREDARPARRIEAVVQRVRSEAAPSIGVRATLALRLASPLAALAERRQSRIFQDQSVPDVLAAILGEAQIPMDSRLSRSYPKRSYCVQYRESDLAFFERLAAEEGIAYATLDAPDDVPGGAPGARVALLDDAAHYPGAAGGEEPAHLALLPDSGATTRPDQITRLARRERLRPTAARLRDYDFRRPNLAMDERVDEPAAPATWLASLERYHHHGDYDEPEVTADKARLTLAQERRGDTTWEGEGFARGLAPACRFVLEAPDAADLGGEYAVVRVEHEARSPELGAPGAGSGPAYRCRFTTVAADRFFPPKLPKRRVRQALETATVVGPAGQDVHTDEHGRVKVEMHWDRRDQGDDRASAWVRVAQAWAGASFGAQFIPRVGMEVLIGFLGGDPDCPVVVGCLYNATHPTPFFLPGEKLKSGFRTQSSPSGGQNELSFDDRAGKERVLLNASRDYDVTVANDHTLTVTGAHKVSVAGSRQDLVAGSQTTQTAGGVLVQVAGSRVEEIAGTHKEEIGGARFVKVHGTDTETVKGSALKTIEQETNLRAIGNLTAEIGTDSAPATADVLAWGDLHLGSYAGLRLRAKDGLSLVCGDALIEITQKAITISAPTIALAATETLTVKGKGPSLKLAEEAELLSDVVKIYSKKASLELDDNAHLNGQLVKLNCGAGRSERGDRRGGQPHDAAPLDQAHRRRLRALRRERVPGEGRGGEGRGDDERRRHGRGRPAERGEDRRDHAVARASPHGKDEALRRDARRPPPGRRGRGRRGAPPEPRLLLGEGGHRSVRRARGRAAPVPGGPRAPAEREARRRHRRQAHRGARELSSDSP